MATDQWAQWLLTRRDGDSADLRARYAPDLAWFRDGVLDRAGLGPDDVLLDVGCGTGLIGFGALDRLGPDGRVIFSDVSQDLLDHCRRTADGDERCSFVQAAAEDLAGIADASVDVVTTRSALMYSDRKFAAFAAFFRVLKPGGRLSIFEPINRFTHEYCPDDLFGLRGGSPVDDLLARVRDVYRGPTEAAERPMVDFDERNLLAWAVDAGFEAVELDYRAQVDVPAEPLDDWEVLKRVAPNPLVPTYGEAIAAALTEEERGRLDAYMTALVAAGTPTRRTMAVAFLRALRP
ncbi:class I SAM-dependent methyltransferase [Micromonospora echinofusca]|uniref:Methyltransferase domain-containing protein n=1 Tax=Micromonospora echinofusca TaxID=47858 RepID=A0ABS3VQL7_MICEH|nr:methyltransferase domain-containing protein [Micromonospora echinofusca]MBO4206810.1 methyltransferase domain-containing protein [Micromonospora echinofusca]